MNMWDSLAGKYLRKQFQKLECDWITSRSIGSLAGVTCIRREADPMYVHSEVVQLLFIQNPHMKSKSWLHFQWHKMNFVLHKWNIMVNLNILLAGYSTLLLWAELIFSTHSADWETKIWHLLFLVSKVSSTASNTWILTLINLYFILQIIMIDKMSS